MTINKKLFAVVALWVMFTAVSFLVAYPRVIKSISDLKLTYASQITELNELRDNSKSLQLMQTSVIQLESEEVQPNEFFSSDTRLVEEIKHIEKIAANTNNQLRLNISGTAASAEPYPSKTGLRQIPFTMGITGSFPDSVRFIEQFEKSYFLAPVNAVNISVGEEGIVSTTIVSAFIVRPDPEVQQ